MAAEYNYHFSAEKNALLKAERRINFDDVIYYIENGGLLDTIRHKAGKYGHQEVFVVAINDYAYAVPFVRNNEDVFLKTIFPDRRLTKYYLRRGL